MDKQPFARGGFGKVYKATRRKDAVVIKVISADSKEEKEEIIREAELILFVWVIRMSLNYLVSRE